MIELLLKKLEADLNAGDYPGTLYQEADFEQAYQITNYIKCHRVELLKNRLPPDQLAHSLQRYQLQNVGFDPCKDPEICSS